MNTNPYDGYRVYNGCPDSTMQKRLDETARLERKLREQMPDARCVYFPSPGYYQVWTGNTPVCGWEEKFASRDAAIRAALNQCGGAA